MNRIAFLHKESNISSAQALNQLKRKFQISSLGHAGTLDPFATGLLIVASGRATKILSYFQGLHKEYVAKVKLGIQTDTDDRTGKILRQSHETVPLCQKLPEILPCFLGEIEQVPPIFSALKVSGQRAYKLARENKEVSLTPRKVQIFSSELLEIDEREQIFSVRVVCSKGTYIRALARDLGEALGSLGTLWDLERRSIGPYNLSDAHTVDDMREEHFKSVESIFGQFPSIFLKEEYLKKVENGAKILPSYLDLSEGVEGYTPSYYRLYAREGRFLGIVENASARFFYRS